MYLGCRVIEQTVVTFQQNLNLPPFLELLCPLCSPGKSHDWSDRLGAVHTHVLHENTEEFQASSHVQANQRR